MSKLITASDIAARDGCASVGEWLLIESRKAAQKCKITRAWDGRSVSGLPVMAYVDFGRWAGRCECGGGTYVDPSEPIFFCLTCGNGGSGMARPVIFPVDMQIIEEALLARPVIDDERAQNKIESARLAKPVIGNLPRNWHPHQSVEVLLAENERLIGGE